MWIIAKYKNKELNLLKKNLTDALNENLFFYTPKIKYQKVISGRFKTSERFILENYLICYHPKFNCKSTLNKLKYTKGLSFFLEGFKNNQLEIENFVNYCKKFKNKEGFISQNFFHHKNFKKGRFTSGPFTDLIFKVISEQGNKLKVLIGDIKTTICKNSNFIYRPI